eukprot:jgi/Mesvir1/25992/Mv20960-RA.1
MKRLKESPESPSRGDQGPPRPLKKYAAAYADPHRAIDRSSADPAAAPRDIRGLHESLLPTPWHHRPDMHNTSHDYPAGPLGPVPCAVNSRADPGGRGSSFAAASDLSASALLRQLSRAGDHSMNKSNKSSGSLKHTPKQADPRGKGATMGRTSTTHVRSNPTSDVVNSAHSAGPTHVRDEVVVQRLREIMSRCSVSQTSTLQLREALERDLRVDLSDRQELVRREMRAFIDENLHLMDLSGSSDEEGGRGGSRDGVEEGGRQCRGDDDVARGERRPAVGWMVKREGPGQMGEVDRWHAGEHVRRHSHGDGRSEDSWEQERDEVELGEGGEYERGWSRQQGRPAEDPIPSFVPRRARNVQDGRRRGAPRGQPSDGKQRQGSSYLNRGAWQWEDEQETKARNASSGSRPGRLQERHSVGKRDEGVGRGAGPSTRPRSTGPGGASRQVPDGSRGRVPDGGRERVTDGSRGSVPDGSWRRGVGRGAGGGGARPGASGRERSSQLDPAAGDMSEGSSAASEVGEREDGHAMREGNRQGPPAQEIPPPTTDQWQSLLSHRPKLYTFDTRVIPGVATRIRLQVPPPHKSEYKGWIGPLYQASGHIRYTSPDGAGMQELWLAMFILASLDRKWRTSPLVNHPGFTLAALAIRAWARDGIATGFTTGPILELWDEIGGDERKRASVVSMARKDAAIADSLAAATGRPGIFDFGL